MPQSEDQSQVTNSPLIEEKNIADASQLDPETDSSKDASDEPVNEPSLEQSLPPTDPLAQPRFSPDKTAPKIASPVSSSKSTIEIDIKKNRTKISYDAESIEQPESPIPSLQAPKVEPIAHSEPDNLSLNAEVATDSKQQQSSQTLDIGSTATATATATSMSLPALPKSSGSSYKPLNSPTSPQLNQPLSAISTRKLTSAFSWLSRATPSKDPSPPSSATTNNAPVRRNTASSIVTTGSTSETTANKLEEANEQDTINGSRRQSRSSLKDRFKILRMRDEAGISCLPENDEEQSIIGSQKSIIFNQKSPKNVNEKDIISPLSPLSLRSDTSLTNAAISAGVTTHPSPPVDWDLWQAVVDEGPVAFAKTSSEKLNQAITTGIPNSIRGVVWQILAQSKNEELETVYRELLNRGTEKDQDRMSNSSGSAGNHKGINSIHGKEEGVISSASSVHSVQSITVNSIASKLRSPSPPKDPEMATKALAASLAEKKRKAKEDAASLQKLEKSIKRDLGSRTSFSKFATSAGLQEGLFGVCKAYALFDEGVGYAQGINFLAMPLLFNMPEDEAFCLLVKMMNQYHLRDLFIQDMPGLHLRLYQFERLLEDLEPALYCHLQRRQVTPHLYATQWFLTLFAYRFPLQLVLRIYDLILSEGLGAIIKVGVVLMQKNTENLLGISDMVALTTFLKDRLFDVYIDAAPSSESILESGFFGSSGSSIDKEIYRADQLIQDACAVKITPEFLNTYALEWKEKTKLEKERENELQGYKLSNQKLSLKVRRLEERVQDHDTEHAALATELVRTKVINEELKDENESLKVQVTELRDVIERLPEEVEKKLKTEMDRLLTRNQEVHEENNRLEEEMSNMEKTLVETKMQYAEIHAAHDALTRKWTDLRKALGD
ncbi:hypothetical protein K3495_g11741 [Podosphaera aphanis]|nr:hypothetical protein K3495_g11741 [Podosphaera aphanis]